mgnify:CR=1 FL=1
MNTCTISGITLNEDLTTSHCITGGIADIAVYNDFAFVHRIADRILGVCVNAGYRAGIHMKAYKDKVPVMVIGGTAGSFLGEYQAGGVIVVLGLA